MLCRSFCQGGNLIRLPLDLIDHIVMDANALDFDSPEKCCAWLCKHVDIDGVFRLDARLCSLS